MAATILLIARLAGFHAEGLFFAVADGAEAIGRDTQGDEIIFYGSGAAVAETEVVFGGTAFVAVTFDGGLNVRVGAKNFGGGGESRARIGANVSFIQIEVRVFDAVLENSVSVAVGVGRLGIRFRNGYAHAGVGGAAGAGGGKSVGCRIGGRRPSWNLRRTPVRSPER